MQSGHNLHHRDRTTDLELFKPQIDFIFIALNLFEVSSKYFKEDEN